MYDHAYPSVASSSLRRSNAARTIAARASRVAALAIAGSLALAGCTSAPAEEATEIVIIAHDSFYLSDGIFDDFTEETGLEVSVITTAGAGELVNQLVLTKDAPLGDVVFGIDDTFASRAVTAGVLTDYVAPAAVESASDLLLADEVGRGQLTPIDYGDVCWNADLAWFEGEGVALPESLDDLIDPRYRDLGVVLSPATSSPGFAFLLATIAAYGEDGWQDYWRALLANGVKVSGSWSDAYYADFSGPGSDGDRPLVLSYASSPAATIDEETGEAGTVAILGTCYRQVEYAGVLAGSDQPEAAQQLVDYLFSRTVQEDIPWSMFMYPANPEATLPSEFAEYAQQASDPYVLDPAVIDENRQAWITAWAQLADR